MPDSPYTAHDHPTGVAALMLAGIDGYVHKSTSQEQLDEVREIVRRDERVWMPGPVTSRTRSLTRIIEYSARLSPREQRVFELVLNRYSNAEIADKLYLSLQTVKNHIGSIFRKCEVRSRKELLRKIFG